MIWLILFIIVVAASFILALRSMSDYQESPLNFSNPYSLFLIKKPEALNEEVLSTLYQRLAPEKLILAFERLFKGPKTALLVYGPVAHLQPLSQTLDLLELEEYSKNLDNGKESFANKTISAWEVGTKSQQDLGLNNFHLKSTLPKFEDHEQFWWQIILQPIGNNTFQSMIRAVIQTQNKQKTEEIEGGLTKMFKTTGLAILPKSHTSEAIIKSYQERNLPIGLPGLAKREGELSLDITEVLALLNL